VRGLGRARGELGAPIAGGAVIGEDLPPGVLPEDREAEAPAEDDAFHPRFRAGLERQGLRRSRDPAFAGTPLNPAVRECVIYTLSHGGQENKNRRNRRKPVKGGFLTNVLGILDDAATVCC